jgi:hypothetical protein
MKMTAFRDDDLAGFPAVDDFMIDLEPSEDGGPHLAFKSRSAGRLAGFPAWDHADRDLRHFTPIDVPFGTATEPYDDRDEGWRIAIFEHDGYVYVLEADDANATEAARFFRVPRDRYIEAWAAIILAFNPLTTLDEESESESESQSEPS